MLHTPRSLLALLVLLAPFVGGCEAIRAALNTPTIQITSPAPGTVIDDTQVRVSGTIQSPAPLSALTWTLNGGTPQDAFNAWNAGTNTFAFTVDGLEPGNNTLRVSATSIDGYTGNETITIRRRDDPPVVVVLTPEDRLVTEDDTVEVTGAITDDYGLRSAQIRVNDEPPRDLLARLGDDGSFAVEVALRPGENEILVRAIDTSEQAEEVRLRVIREVPEPLSIAIASPEEGDRIVGDALVLEGQVRGASAVDTFVLSVGAEDLDVRDTLTAQGDGLTFAILVEGLEPGPLTLRLTAAEGDRAAVAERAVVVEEPVERCPSLLVNGGAEAWDALDTAAMWRATDADPGQSGASGTDPEGSAMEEPSAPASSGAEPTSADPTASAEDPAPTGSGSASPDASASSEPLPSSGAPEPSDAPSSEAPSSGTPSPSAPGAPDPSESGSAEEPSGTSGGSSSPGETMDPDAPSVASAAAWERVAGTLLSVAWGSAEGLPVDGAGPADRGERHFAAADAPTVRARQDISLAAWSDTIEEGGVTFFAEAWLGALAGSEDEVRMRVVFRRQDEPVQAFALGPVGAPSGAGGEVLRRFEVVGDVPVSAESVRVELVFEDGDGDGRHEAFADALRLELQHGDRCLAPAAD